MPIVALQGVVMSRYVVVDQNGTRLVYTERAYMDQFIYSTTASSGMVGRIVADIPNWAEEVIDCILIDGEAVYFVISTIRSLRAA